MEEWIPLWPESPPAHIPHRPPSSPLTQVTHNQNPASVQRTHTPTNTHTRIEASRVPCSPPGPRWSLVWRPVCVCLPSNGPFKCRIFTADRAVLGDAAAAAARRSRALEYAGAPLSWRKLSLLSWRSATQTGNELATKASSLLTSTGWTLKPFVSLHHRFQFIKRQNSACDF